MKKLLLSIGCINENYSEAPDYLVVELSQSMIDRITQLSDKVKALNVYSIEYLDDAGSYCSSETIESLIEDNEIVSGELTEQMIAGMNDERGRMDCMSIIVYRSEFMFQAVPKHLGDTEYCHSGKIPVSVLSSPDTLDNINW